MLKPGFKLVAIPLFGAVLGLAALDMRAAQAEDSACTAYPDRNWKGQGAGLGANQHTEQSRIADKISSFRMVSGCHVEAFENDKLSGPNQIWASDVAYVGKNWDNLISSWRCVCGDEERPKHSDRPRRTDRPSNVDRPRVINPSRLDRPQRF